MESVDIEFENLTYCTRDNKQILNSVRGKFSAGKLAAILGPSGAGKSSLLNILAGFIHDGVSGDIYVNNKPRNNKAFHKMSSYITQEDIIQHHLTVKECIHIAANLKLGTSMSTDQKQKTIDAILKSMCLEQCVETRTENLSGGQRKRLIIALELVDNPPVIFLDEPTTGLDEVTLLSCMKLFKKLTSLGHTIICTIHQPSDNVFNLLDYVYFLSSGKCVYKGTTEDIVPFLEQVKLSCPVTYNPADYIIEIIYQNDEITTFLSDQIENWKSQKEEDFVWKQTNKSICCERNPASFWYQVSILIKRRFLQTFRNKLQLSIQISHNIFTGICVGLIFYKMGNDASNLPRNLFIFYALNFYLIFTQGITMVLLYPFEIKLLQREYLNRWYNLKAYFLAFNIATFPITCIGTIILSLVIYYMTGQPTDEIYRIFWLTFATVLYALTSQGFGLAVATVFQPVNGACVGSAIGIALVVLSVYGTGYGMEITQTMRSIMSLSYVYHAYSAYLISLFRLRGLAECAEVLCYFYNPRDLLKAMGMDENDYLPSILYLSIYLVLYRLLAYVIIRGRVNPDTKLYKMLQ